MESDIKSKKTDFHLWQELKAGNKHAFDTIFRENYTSLYNYGLKITHDEAVTEDCIQELFIRLWDSRAHLADLHFIKSYLFKSYRRSLITHLQVLQKQDSIDNLNETNFGISFSAEDILIQEQTKTSLLNQLLFCLNQLPERQKEVVFLKFYGGFSYSEIAEIMRVNKQSVANLLNRAFASLKKRMNLLIIISNSTLSLIVS